MFGKIFLSSLAATLTVLSMAAAPEGDYIDVHSYNRYKYRPDGTPGREIYVSYKGNRKLSKGKIEIRSVHGSELIPFVTDRPDSIPVLLPEGIGVASNDTIIVGLYGAGLKMYTESVIPKMRHWTVYIYPHSHVDIGYTNTQEDVEYIHKTNLDVAMELSEKTAGYPEDARFRWNPEVTWPVERYLNSADSQQRERLLSAMREGRIVLDAGYISTNTSAASDEELLELFRFAKEMEPVTGRKVETMVQVDVPGMSWGVVAAANQLGIKNCISYYNGVGRIGNSDDMCFKPYWWTGPDGKSKVFFLQTASYNPGYLYKGFDYWYLVTGLTDRSKMLRVVKTDNPRENFIDEYLDEYLTKLENSPEYIYDIFPMTWCMADNQPIDADLPDAVKSWNEEFAFPHLKICTATEMAEAYTSRYADKIPEISGDYTEYWTDGLGSAATQTGRSREDKERLVQSEILWSMLHPGESAPDSVTREAWRHVLLSTEHTWAYREPDKQPISNDILRTKFGYFDVVSNLTKQSMDMAFASIADDDSGIISVFNTNSWERSSLVTLDKELSASYNGVQDFVTGEVISSQKLTTGQLVFVAENVPAVGQKTYRLVRECGEQPQSYKVMNTAANGNFILDNGIVRVEVDNLTGDVVSLLYGGQEFVDRTSVAGFNSYRYLKGNNSSGYAYTQGKTTVTFKESGPVVYSILAVSEAEGARSLKREIILTAGSDIVEFCNEIDKIAITEKEGVHFGFSFNVPGGKTMVNIPWGVMELGKDQFAAGNKNWIAAQRWIDVTNGEKGVTWCPVNSSTFESGDITANILDAALDSPQWLYSLPQSSTLYSWALNNHWYTNFPLYQEGKIPFRYTVRPYIGVFDKAESNRVGMEPYRPLVPVQVSEQFAEDGNVPGSFIIKGGEGVYLSNYRTIKEGKESLIRFISMSDKDEEISIAWKGRKPSSMYVLKQIISEPQPVGAYVAVPARSGVTVVVKW